MIVTGQQCYPLCDDSVPFLLSVSVVIVGTLRSLFTYGTRFGLGGRPSVAFSPAVKPDP